MRQPRRRLSPSRRAVGDTLPSQPSPPSGTSLGPLPPPHNHQPFHPFLIGHWSSWPHILLRPLRWITSMAFPRFFPRPVRYYCYCYCCLLRLLLLVVDAPLHSFKAHTFFPFFLTFSMLRCGTCVSLAWRTPWSCDGNGNGGTRTPPLTPHSSLFTLS